MNIAILDECFFLDNHLDQLKSLGNLKVYQQTTNEDDLITRLKDVDIAIIDGLFSPLNKRVLESTNNLKFISLNTTGYDGVDLETATQKGIKVSNAPGYATESVAELAIALMLSVIRQIPQADRKMRETPFQIDPADKSQENFMGVNLKDKTLGVVGLGTIGARVAELGQGLGMKVIGFNKHPKVIEGVRMVALDDLLKESDVVSINLALNKETEHIIGERELSLMKEDAIIINTARGAHIETQALYDALKKRRIKGAGLDVLEEWTKDNPLLELDNIVLTPHEAFFTKESLENLANLIIENVESFVKGSPINLVN